jgi:diguanylate cyclase (GGDEF)-like protein
MADVQIQRTTEPEPPARVLEVLYENDASPVSPILVHAAELAQAGFVQQLEAEKENLERLLMQDPLTGAYNARALSRFLARQIGLAKRYHDPFCLVMIDLDHFKLINDRFGHLCGDTVLSEFVKRATAVLREGDILARYGGDEFMLITPNTMEEGAIVAVEKLIDAVKARPIEWEDHTIHITLSVGIAAFHLHEEISQRELVQRTDRALYAAKQAGRDCYRVWTKDINGLPSRISSASEREVARIVEHVERIEARQRREAVRSLLDLLEKLRDEVPYVWDQTLGATDTAVRLAAAAGLSPREIERVRLATLLRDIGLTGVPRDILSKKEPLSPQERQRIREHVAIGVKIIQPVSSLKDLLSIVLHHHERFDGTGYPSGLQCSQIPVEARVIAIADTFDALIADRPYRSALPVEQAVETIRARKGQQFDPELVSVFSRVASDLAKRQRNASEALAEYVGESDG